MTRYPLSEARMYELKTALLFLLICALLPQVPAEAADKKSPPPAKSAVKSAPAASANPMLEANKAYTGKDYGKARGVLIPLADQGNRDALFAMGLMAVRGDGLPKPDFQSAESFWQKAGQAGHPEAQFQLGLLYHRGSLGKPDQKSAYAWWLKAAVQGQGDAMYGLGRMLRAGDGVPKDEAAAAAWFEKAAGLGHPDAQMQLAGMYLNGAGVPKDLEKSRYWMNKAAAQGHPQAQRSLKLLGTVK